MGGGGGGYGLCWEEGRGTHISDYPDVNDGCTGRGRGRERVL